MKNNYIEISKNRGWRGLAKIVVYDAHVPITRIFSFSQDMWVDLIKYHRIVVKDDDKYFVLRLNDGECKRYLPKPTQQRSVLIQYCLIPIEKIVIYNERKWSTSVGDLEDVCAIRHFTQNTNNHTKSDWNYIGVRVVPEI